MKIKSKYQDYGEIEVVETKRSYLYIAKIQNNSDSEIEIFIDDLEGWYSDPIKIKAHSEHELLRDDDGRATFSDIKNGDFKVVNK